MSTKGGIELILNTAHFKGAITDAVQTALEEIGAELESQTARNQTRVKTGATKGGWTHVVGQGEVTIGNPLENAIWEEYGTGDYAEKGGRKGGWVYKASDGNFYKTHGKKPIRPLRTAFDQNKGKVQKRFEQALKGVK